MPKREPRAPGRPKTADAQPPVPEPRPTRARKQAAARPTRVSEPAVYNLYEAKTQLSALVDRAAGGEEIVIAKAGVPVARLMPFPAPGKPVLRKPGMWKGKIWVADDFDDPLPPEIQKYFDDPQIFPEEWDDEGRRR